LCPTPHGEPVLIAGKSVHSLRDDAGAMMHLSRLGIMVPGWLPAQVRTAAKSN